MKHALVYSCNIYSKFNRDTEEKAYEKELFSGYDYEANRSNYLHESKGKLKIQLNSEKHIFLWQQK